MKKVMLALEEQKQYADIGPATITAGQTEDIDWINNWKKFFSSFYLDDILIKPTWEELKPEDEGKVMIEIDPGISFGTGKHETTQHRYNQILRCCRCLYRITVPFHESVSPPASLDLSSFPTGNITPSACSPEGKTAAS